MRSEKLVTSDGRPIVLASVGVHTGGASTASYSKPVSISSRHYSGHTPPQAARSSSRGWNQIYLLALAIDRHWKLLIMARDLKLEAVLEILSKVRR